MNFHKISRFIGKHETHFNSFDDAKQLYFASRKYQIQDLESRCLKYISSIANHTNVCQIFEFAQAVSNTELLGTCTNIMAWDIKQVLESPDFLCSKISTLKYIYTMDDLIIDSEIELFKALEKWIQLHIEIVSTGKCVVMCVWRDLTWITEIFCVCEIFHIYMYRSGSDKGADIWNTIHVDDAKWICGDSRAFGSANSEWEIGLFVEYCVGKVGGATATGIYNEKE